LMRWEASLHNPQVDSGYNRTAAPRKKSILSRVLLTIILVLVGIFTVFFINNYHLYLGRMFLEQGNIPKALQHFEKAADNNPKDVDLRFMLGDIYFQMGTMDAAIAAYKKCIELDSLHAGALNNLAWVYAQMDYHLDEALSLSKRSLEVEPDNPAFLDTLAEIYFLKKEYYRALTYIRKALDQNPPNIEYYREKLKKIKRLAYSQRRFLEV